MYILDLFHKCHFLFKVTLSYQRSKQSSAALRENKRESVISVPLCLCVVMSLSSVDIVCFLSVPPDRTDSRLTDDEHAG